MELILAKECASFTGSLGKCGYSIQRHNNRFFAKRNSKGIIPPDGHWRFIIHCAQLTNYRIYATDIILPAKELIEALEEADICYAPRNLNHKPFYHARDILTLIKTL